MPVAYLAGLAAAWSQIERVPGFLIRGAIAKWPFSLMMGVSLAFGVGIDLRRRGLGRELAP